MERALAGAGLQRRIGLRAPSMLVVPHVLAQTDLLFTGPRALLAPLAEALVLGLVAVPLEIPRARVGMAWHERFQADPAHQWFRDLVGRQVSAAFL